MSLSLHVLSLLGAASPLAAALPQQPFPEVATWTPSKSKPLAIAQLADKKVGALRKVECEEIIQFGMPKRGGTGTSTLVSQIQDPKYFALEYLVVSFVKRSEIDTGRVRSNGKDVVWTQTAGKKPIRRKIGQVGISKNAKPEDWLMNHNRYVLGATLGETPFTDLVRQAQKLGSGYQVNVHQRTIRRLNVPYPQYKVSITRTALAAKSLGPVRIEAIIDAKQGLPVTVAAEGQPKGKEPFVMVNNIRWKVRKKNFDLKSFTLFPARPEKKKPTVKKG